MRLTIILLLYFVHHSIADSCSTEVCNKWNPSDDVINVHLVCHTHDDLGWLKTVEQYFDSSDGRNHESVEDILNSVVAELETDPEKKFSWSETGFLSIWLNRDWTTNMKKFKKLLQQGQIEIVGGGWVQNDEAAAHYVDMVDQMTLGLSRMNETFGRCSVPKVAWQIDPFGHSREQANLFSMMGFEALFFSRFHYAEKTKRLQEKSMEMMWKGSDDLDTNLYTGAFYAESYGPPHGFCFDVQCWNRDLIIDDPSKPEYNVKEKARVLVEYVRKQAATQRHNHVMLTMGSDFQYTVASAWYDNLDKLINYMNKQEKETKVRLFYSTPGCYVKAVGESHPDVPQKVDDFFPYASAANSYWTGFFTSRPAFKGFIRRTTGLMQLAKQLHALSMVTEQEDMSLDPLRQAMAIAQHHDAVTGTAKEHVTQDYIKRLAVGWDQAEGAINLALKKLSKSEAPTLANQQLCRKSNETACMFTRQQQRFTVTAFNANSHNQSAIIMIPQYGKSAQVTGLNGEEIESQETETFSTKISNANTAPHQLFVPVSIPALGFTTISVDAGTAFKSPFARKPTRMERPKVMSKNRHGGFKSSGPTTITNGIVELSFDNSGRLANFKNTKRDLELSLEQEFMYYEGNEWSQASGAYVFRPKSEDPISAGNPVILGVEKGPIVNEVRQQISPWISQTIRLYKDKEYVEFEWTVGPIPREHYNPITKEVITRYSSDIASNGLFYTDSNGRQMMQRKRDYSPSFEFTNAEPVSGNYYPVDSMISLKDESAQMTVLIDRAEGGSSLADGQIELMVHRRSFYDDGFGVSEPLNEPGETGEGLIVRGRHWLMISSPSEAASLVRPLAFEMLYAPVLTFAPSSKLQAKALTEFSGLARDLPPQVHIMTLEHWGEQYLLLRLEHIYQGSEDDALGVLVTVDLKGLFATFEITEMVELMLGGNVYKAQESEEQTATDNFEVQLRPMEIRTFRLTVQEKQRK